MKGSTGALPYPHEHKLQGVISAGFMYTKDGPTVTTSGIFVGDDSVVAPFDPHNLRKLPWAKLSGPHPTLLDFM